MGEKLKVYGGHYFYEIRPGVRKNTRIIVACENRARLEAITGIRGNYLSRHFSETYNKQEMTAALEKPGTVLTVNRLPLGEYEFKEPISRG